MAETTKNAQHENVDQKKTGRARKVGEVVSTKMNKTIVVKVDMKKAHPLYRRVITSSKRFHVHDEENKALLGDIVRERVRVRARTGASMPPRSNQGG